MNRVALYSFGVIVLAVVLVAASFFLPFPHGDILRVGIAVAATYVVMDIERRGQESTLDYSDDDRISVSRDEWDDLNEVKERYTDALEKVIFERDTAQRELDLAEDRLATVVPIDPSCLQDGFAHVITQYTKKPEGRYGGESDIIGWTTNGAVAAKHVEKGSQAKLVRVWVLPDGRIAHRNTGHHPTLHVIKEIEA